jgi:hypothetical protein
VLPANPEHNGVRGGLARHRPPCQHAGMTIAPWSSDDWWREAEAWLDGQLAARGIRRTGEVTQPHLRPWATVLRAPTTRGVVWLKAAGPQTAFEVELYRLLEQVVPDRILVPLASDARRGWIVLPDGGVRLGERLDDLDLVEAMVEVLPRYGELQRSLEPHVEELLGLGLADMRAAVMPRRFEEATAAVGRYVGRHGTEGDRETLRRAAAMAGRFQGWCERLGGAAVGASLDHNDLHLWNVFVDPGAGPGTVGRVRFYDWGDSVVAHPFASMLLGLGMIRLQLKVAADDPAVTRPRDAYLEVFGDLASHGELVEELELACRVGKALRALESLLSDSAIVAV